VVIVVWSAAPERVAAIVALPEFVDRTWRPEAVRAASPASLHLAPADARATPATKEPGAAVASRAALETGLPWTVVATVAADEGLDGMAARERMLLAGLAAVLLLAAAGSYLVVRARGQEIALSRLQSDFVAAVSHEFRTPLTALGQFNELLEDEDGLPADSRRAYHQAQTRATERLHRLVESLLDFGRMEAGRRPFAFKPVDAGVLVSDVVDEFRGELGSREFEVRCEIQPGLHTIAADAEALSRAVWNLLDNAVKYSGERREVQVTVGEASAGQAPPKPAVAIEVRDFGIGVPRREQARIFEKFVRAEGATASRIKGTGIGLSMARHIVSAHRGRILVDSEPGRGSAFTIVIGRSPSCASWSSKTSPTSPSD
jgi:signal transduction histidine kinase